MKRAIMGLLGGLVVMAFWTIAALVDAVVVPQLPGVTYAHAVFIRTVLMAGVVAALVLVLWLMGSDRR